MQNGRSRRPRPSPFSSRSGFNARPGPRSAGQDTARLEAARLEAVPLRQAVAGRFPEPQPDDGLHGAARRDGNACDAGGGVRSAARGVLSAVPQLLEAEPAAQEYIRVPGPVAALAALAAATVGRQRAELNRGR